MNTPDFKHPLYTTMSALWSICRDFMSGTAAVRAGRETYLPKHSAEELDDYDVRLKYAVVYNAFARAVDAITGLAFQKDPVLGEDIGPSTKTDWENIDLQGTHGDVFTRRLMSEGLQTGYVGILVDQPVAPGRAVSLRDERALGLRPYWVSYRAEQIINWRTGIRNGRVVLSLLVLAESVAKDQGLFGTVYQPQWRVFIHEEGTSPRWEVWRSAVSNGPIIKMEEGTLTVSRIPFVIARLGRSRPGAWLDVSPPLYDLAELNQAHYRLLADRRHIMHLACVPILAEIGGSAPKPGQTTQPIGPGVLVKIPNPEGDLKYVEPQGTGMAPTREELLDTERRMAQVSLAFLASETRAAETAEAKRIDSAAQNATLGSAIRSMEDAIEEALGFHAEYRKEPAGSITLNRDFEELQLTPELIKTYSDIVAAGQLDLDTFWELLKRGRILPVGFEGDLVKERLLLNGGTVPDDKTLDTPPNADQPADMAA